MKKLFLLLVVALLCACSGDAYIINKWVSEGTLVYNDAGAPIGVSTTYHIKTCIDDGACVTYQVSANDFYNCEIGNVLTVPLQLKDDDITDVTCTKP